MKMYLTRSLWEFKIEEVEVVRSSEHSVWIIERNKERRHSKEGYYDSWLLAKQAIVDRKRAALESAEERLKYAQVALRAAIALEPSKETV